MTPNPTIQPIPLLSTMTFLKAIEILSAYLNDYHVPMNPDFDAAITVALFNMRLTGRGDFTYEPLH